MSCEVGDGFAAGDAHIEGFRLEPSYILDCNCSGQSIVLGVKGQSGIELVQAREQAGG